MTSYISEGELGQLNRSMTPSGLRFISRSVNMYDSYNYAYSTIYRTQPNVRVCVEFLARNIAQLGLHTFQLGEDDSRSRVRGHPLSKLLKMPLPRENKVTQFNLFNSLVSDMGIYFNAYWLKLQTDSGTRGLLRLPPQYVTVEGALTPKLYRMDIAGGYEFKPEQIVHFKGFNPDDPLMGLSPLETLRRVLAEEHEAGNYRENLWKNAARMSGIVERPVNAPEWDDDAIERFRSQFQSLYAGPTNSGKTAVLEDGMRWRTGSFSPKETEYLAGRKLTREECARAYHIPLPMVGILENATFSNISEQHKQLYMDSLGPWLKMIEQDIELQLLPDFEDNPDLYVEFNILEKLRGDFETQSKSYQSAVGAPWMTRNEARQRMNMPNIEGGDELITPLNVIEGTQASPQDATNDANKGQKSLQNKAFSVDNETLRKQSEKAYRSLLYRYYNRVQKSIMPNFPKLKKSDLGGVWFDRERWDKELGVDLFALNVKTAAQYAQKMDDQTGAETSEDAMTDWLSERAATTAEFINDEVEAKLREALLEDDPKEAGTAVFDTLISTGIFRQAVSMVTTVGNFGVDEGAKAASLNRKSWKVNSSNPRPEHAKLNGEVVGINERFSNGMRWAGDPVGGADNNAGCLCSVEYLRE